MSSDLACRLPFPVCPSCVPTAVGKEKKIFKNCNFKIISFQRKQQNCKEIIQTYSSVSMCESLTDWLHHCVEKLRMPVTKEILRELLGARQCCSEIVLKNSSSEVRAKWSDVVQVEFR